MPERDKVLAVVREWMVKAENDLKTAAHTLELGDDCPTDTVCFHAQQCVEKYIKASLVVDRIDFPKTHDVEALATLMPKRVRPNLSAAEAAKLCDYATGARYPGWCDIPLSEARRAVALARRIRKQIRAKLPREVLRRSRH
jgi:HEPN domain-containing protein